MHAMPLNIRQRSDRPKVARRVNFATRTTPKLYGHSRPTGLENYLICELGALLNSL